MKVLIEGQNYDLDLLKRLFNSDRDQFYTINQNEGKISTVGYYHNFDSNEIIYMLPKVFMRDEEITVFGFKKEHLVEDSFSPNIKKGDEYNWVRHLSIIFYKSLSEYKKRIKVQNIIKEQEVPNLRSNLGNKEFSYLDLLLSFVNYYKKNKLQITFINKENKNRRPNKVNWEKTVMNSRPILTKNKAPIYQTVYSKSKEINNEEDLFRVYFSILNFFDKEHALNINIPPSIEYVPHRKFKKKKNTLYKLLKKIRSNYFSDSLKRMVRLCELYFSIEENASVKNRTTEFIIVDNYNLVFEDMIDKLVATGEDELLNEYQNSIIPEMKVNRDGKIIDHIYDYQSLIDTSNIFYIGDSKYYKPENKASTISKYKQITYAKNIIQYNIDLFNTEGSALFNTRYRDKITEGYNITPNFFIYGFISDYRNYTDPQISERGEPTNAFHFKYRLFDRDTLFILKYRINFLFVINAYVEMNNQRLRIFRRNIKVKFRKNFIDYFNGQSGGFEYSFYRKKFESSESEDLDSFINQNFKVLNGKCILTKDNFLIIAKHCEDNSLDGILGSFQKFELS
ncbi:MAG: hypothetical protein MK198_06850 [Gracilimonas sp.]|uniref:hypothetical protein n=1 Tax=Gracilimonas sp. TaxID=1974203 RepID=UPI0037537243|nr:hypothetical protein [Gracilimonas sp.]